MTNPAGKAVTGALTGTTWHSTEDLGYGRTYTVTATGTDAQGDALTRTSRFTTVTPATQVDASIDRIGGYALGSGATYGVGIVPDRALRRGHHRQGRPPAVLKNLTVTTTPHVAGAWAWFGEPRTSTTARSPTGPAGTKVTVGRGDLRQGPRPRASTVQSDVSDGRSRSAAPQVDDRHRTTRRKGRRQGAGLPQRHPGAHDEHLDGQAQRHVRSNGNYIDFHTMNGTYTVLEHDNPAIMSSASYGLHGQRPGRLRPRADLPRHQDQHRRHLPALPEHDLRPGQRHRRLARLPEPQRRQRRLVLRPLDRRRPGADLRHARPDHPRPAGRRLERPVERLGLGQHHRTVRHAG